MTLHFLKLLFPFVIKLIINSCLFSNIEYFPNDFNLISNLFFQLRRRYSLWINMIASYILKSQPNKIFWKLFLFEIWIVLYLKHFVHFATHILLLSVLTGKGADKRRFVVEWKQLKFCFVNTWTVSVLYFYRKKYYINFSLTWQ